MVIILNLIMEQLSIHFKYFYINLFSPATYTFNDNVRRRKMALTMKDLPGIVPDEENEFILQGTQSLQKNI